VKGIQRKNDVCFFRVSLRLYPEDFVKKIFGEGRKEENYVFFEKTGNEEKIYEGFNQLMEMIANGG
jgi:hypothetical protein